MVAMSPWPSMPKPTTGLPVLAMPSTTRLVQPVLDADDHDGGDVRIGAGADQRAEVEIEVGAELQATIGVREGKCALDIVRDRLARRVREIVERQDDDMIAHADTAVFTAPAMEGEIGFVFRGGLCGSFGSHGRSRVVREMRNERRMCGAVGRLQAYQRLVFMFWV